VECIERAVYRALHETTLSAWSTVTPEGKAHVNIGYFAYAEQFELYLLSHPNSVHSRNLQSNPSMAVAVYTSTQRWTDPGRGIQLFGSCVEAAGADLARAQQVYGERFPDFAVWKAALSPGDPARDYHLYSFTAHKLKILDESEFGDAVFVEVDVV
jgi:uncharacterized protein YhbP (UPF0306 family)